MDLNNVDLSKLSDEELDALDAQLAQQEQAQPQMPQVPEDLSTLSDEELDALDSQLAGLEQQQQTPSESEKLIQKSQESLTPEETEYSEFESGMMGALQGASLGAADEIGGGLKTAYDLATGNADFAQIAEQYEKNRESFSDEFKQAQEENPGAYNAGDMAGAVGTAFVPGLGAVRGVKGAAALGAASGFFRSEGDISGRVTDAMLGGAMGGAAGVVANKVVSPLAKAVGRKARQGASKAQAMFKQKTMAKSLGFTDEFSANNLDVVLETKGLKGAADLVELADEVGTPIEGGKVLNPMQMRKNIQKSLEGYGKVINQVMDEVDIASNGPSINPTMLMAKLRSGNTRMAKELASDTGYVRREAEDYLKSALFDLQSEGMWTANRLWKFRTSIRQSVSPKALDGAGSSLNTLKRKLHDDLGDILDEIIEGAGPSGNINKEIFRGASRKYAKLSTLDNIVGENLEIASQGAAGGVRKAVSLAPLLNVKNVAAGAVGGVPGVAAAMAIDSFLKTPLASKMAAKSLSKVSSVLVKNNRYAAQLIEGASRSEAAFNRLIGAGEALYDFTRAPIPRTTAAVKENVSKITSLLELDNPQIAANLRDAVEKNDDALIRGIMNGLSKSSAAAQYIEPGTGWDNTAIDEGDIQDVENMIKQSSASSVQKAQLMQQFSSDRKIPTIEEEKPFFKVYDPSLKTSVMK